jgi:hypothetical protein
LAILALLAPFQSKPGNHAPSVVVYVAAEGDSRLAAVSQAITFWNQTLSGLHLSPAFQPARIVVSPRLTRTLQTYATRISKDGWKDDAEYGPGAPGLMPPPEVTDLSGDVLVLLSTQPILSFAWPLGAGRYFVTIRSGTIPPLNTVSARRNVVAHELGHTLGLMHNQEPGTLMCASCEMTLPASARSLFLPLTQDDRTRLMETHDR